MFDYAIVGSGVSGGRIAHDLTQSGAKCVLIEAGRDFSLTGFFNNEMDYSTQMFWGGGLEISTDGTLGFLRAKCLGGTSVVNQALLDPFDEIAWADWKGRTGISFFNVSEMKPHYDACSSQMSISEIPQEHYNKNARKFISAFEQVGFGWGALHRAQTDCKLEKGSDCIVCLGGCPRGSKQSSLVTVISKAKERGLEIETEFEVSQLQIHDNDARIQGIWRGTQKEIKASKVILAAGALGNSRILFKSNMGHHLPALGKFFCCHPQFMTYAFFDEVIDAHKGAFQAVEGKDPRFRKMGLKFENVFAPPIGTAMLIPGFGKQHFRKMKKYRWMASMEVALRDEPSGSLYLKADRIQIQKHLTPVDEEKAKLGLDMVRQFFTASGAKDVVQCNQGFGLHLMGGCSIGLDSSNSVVNPDFQVHGHKNLYVADSSIFPAAPGINPSFTIMALSHRAGQLMIRSS